MARQPDSGGTGASGRVAEARWRAVIDAAVDGIIVIDGHGIIEVFNPAAQRMFGYGEAEAVGQNVTLLMPEPDRSRHDAYLERHRETGDRRIIGTGRQVTGRRRDGHTFPIHLSVGEMLIDGAPHFTGIVRDLSSQVELEDRLREATSLARVGEMAAVIAHEVKNPLAAVRGAIQVLGGRLPTGTADADIVKEVIARIDALNDLVQDLLVFARPPQPKRVPVDLHGLLHTVSGWLTRDPAFAALQVTIAGDALPVQADPNLLTIVFQNLLINAAQAVQGRGVLRLRLYAPGPGWRGVEVADDGPGIPPEIRAALFRPFKTTKARGTGLGMATAKRLVELHEGRIAVECPERGTIVRVELPQLES
jgi:two-component system sensor kinase FixL